MKNWIKFYLMLCIGSFLYHAVVDQDWEEAGVMCIIYASLIITYIWFTRLAKRHKPRDIDDQGP